MANLKRILTGAIDSTTKGIKTVYQTLAETGDGTYAPVVAATLTGSYLTVDPETGVKTVTTTAAEVFAGLSALPNRDKLIVYNEGATNVYWGKGTVTPTTGFPLLPGDSVVFTFNPAEDMPIYFIAEANTVVRVGELA